MSYIRYVWIGPDGVFKSYVRQHSSIRAAVNDLMSDGYTRSASGLFEHSATPGTRVRLEDLGEVKAG